MRLFDTHAHLESSKFDDDRDQVIARALDVGVIGILTCGSSLASSQSAIALAQSHPALYAAVGIHAHKASSVIRADLPQGDIPKMDDAALQQLIALAKQPRVVALGEIGLDYHYDFSPRPVQRVVLAQQLALAHELGLPVILHNRESDADLREIVDAAPRPLRGVLHCFLADDRMATWALERGLYIGVGGPITFKNVHHLRPIIQKLPLERLLIETDSPYLAPHPVRGGRNEPAYVRHIAAKLADLLGLSPDEVARRTTENAYQLFGIG